MPEVFGEVAPETVLKNEQLKISSQNKLQCFCVSFNNARETPLRRITLLEPFLCYVIIDSKSQTNGRPKVVRAPLAAEVSQDGIISDVSEKKTESQ